MIPAEHRAKLTPPEIARLWGLSPEKVLTWIKTGELRALNAATRTGGRPRFLVDRADLAEFERRRTVAPNSKATRRRKRRMNDVIEFF
jgi:hypothetical protein